MGSFDKDAFERQLNTADIGRHIIYLKSTSSTMDDAKDLCVKGPGSHGSVVMADVQTKARGSRNRRWNADSEGNIYTSIVLCDNPNKNSFEGVFTMEVAACLSVREALVEQGVVGIYTKWPNDLWLRGHKLCGVMVEPYEMDTRLYVMGIGLNLNADCRRNTDLCSIATSVRCERNGVPLSRETTLAYICNSLEKNLTKTQSGLREMFLDHLLYKPSDGVVVLQDGKSSDGTYMNVLENWNIEVRYKNGDTVSGTSRQMSVRPAPSQTICVCEGEELDSTSAGRLYQTLTSLTDLTSVCVAHLDTQQCTLPGRPPEHTLVAVGDVKLDKHTGDQGGSLVLTPALVKLGHLLKELLLAGGSVLAVAGGCVLVQKLLQECCQEPQSDPIIPLQTDNTVISVQTTGEPASHFTLPLDGLQLKTSSTSRGNVLAVYDNDRSPAVVCRTCSRGKVCFCLPNIEVTYADIVDTTLSDIMKEGVFNRDVLVQKMLSELCF
ncbi:uncharacterized protein [Haliotis cracherodii]|uniref:uncharacterized protein n=1 Tax=Haliotis cracherodii TaxID=6455 RepID=UPI0039EA1B56